MLTIALSKGKMLDLALDVFHRAGYALGSLSTESRRLVFPCPEIGMTFLIVRPPMCRPMSNMARRMSGLSGKTS
jgi:ATP phosphoribosyltransferase